MNLRAKLQRLRSAGPGSGGLSGGLSGGGLSDRSGGASPAGDPAPGGGSDPAARVTRLRGLLGKMIADEQRRLRDRPRPTVKASKPLPGDWIETPSGRLHRVAAYLEPAHHHGRVRIARAVSVSARTIAKLALDESLQRIDPRRLLFIDTETTGLSGGAGTLPFLIGLAWFEGESLRVEQLLLRAPGEEVPMLERLAERIAASSGIVSYNGKAFDWPLLRNRFVLNRVPVATPPAHLDLLHCARRIFKRRLGRVKLTHMEERVLGMRRERDIDGAEIPALYWELVRGGDGSLIAPVIEHNANDLIALAAILVTMVDLYEQLHHAQEPADQLGVAQVAVRNADVERAGRYAAAAAAGGGPDDVTADALWLASELARKRADLSGRRALLHRGLEMASGDPRRRARFHLALAKHYEHTEKRLPLALIHARATDLEEGEAARDHRVQRLLRKIERERAQRTV